MFESFGDEQLEPVDKHMPAFGDTPAFPARGLGSAALPVDSNGEAKDGEDNKAEASSSLVEICPLRGPSACYGF